MIRKILAVIIIFVAFGMFRNYQYDTAEREDWFEWSGFQGQKVCINYVQNNCREYFGLQNDFSSMNADAFIERYGESCFDGARRWLACGTDGMYKALVRPSWFEKIFTSYDPSIPGGHK